VKTKPAAWTAALVLASACAARAPVGARSSAPAPAPAPDPAQAYRGLTLAVVSSTSTATYADDAAAPSARTLGSDGPFNAVVALLRARFGSVVMAYDAAQRKASGADLYAAVDVRALVPRASGDLALDETVRFQTPEGKAVDAIAASIRQPFDGASVFAAGAGAGPLSAAGDEAARRLSAGLDSARALAAFAAGRARPTPAARRSDVDAPEYRGARRPDDYALVIGIEHYFRLADARFAAGDARAVRDHLAALGLPERNIAVLIDRQATKAAISRELEQRLARNAGENSTVYVYYAGAGGPDPASDGACLAAYDSVPLRLEETGLPVRRLYDELGALKARRVLVVLDAGFSSAGGIPGSSGRTVRVDGARAPADAEGAGVPADGRVMVLTAARADQAAGFSEEHVHGALTYYLLKGLNGAARDARGRVTLQSLYDYLAPRVAADAVRDERAQTPRLAPASAPALILR
jgi:hypothetical protein